MDFVWGGSVKWLLHSSLIFSSIRLGSVKMFPWLSPVSVIWMRLACDLVRMGWIRCQKFLGSSFLSLSSLAKSSSQLLAERRLASSFRILIVRFLFRFRCLMIIGLP